MRAWLLVIALLPALPCLQASAGEEARDGAKALGIQEMLGELEAVNKEIRDLEVRSAELAKAWQKNRASLERDLARAEREVASRKELLSDLKARTSARSHEIEAVEKETADQDSVGSAVALETNRWLDRLHSLVQGGIAWKTDRRLMAISEARFFTSGERPNQVTMLSAVERLQKQEEALGRMIESGTVRLSLDGSLQEVQAFHLGKMGVVFSDKEGKIAGFARAGVALEEAAKTTSNDAGARYSYSRAIDVLFKRRAPHVAGILFPGFERQLP